MFRKLALVCVFGSFVCSTSAREFPLCVYGVSKPEQVKIAKDAGFTCFQSYTKNPDVLANLAKKAKAHHLKTVFYPVEVVGSEQEKNAQNWPMLAWYLVDEPDVHKWSRAKVTETQESTKKTFPHHPTTLVIGQGITRVPFYDLPDIMMIDWYPVPHLPLTSFGDNVRMTKKGMQKYHKGENPLWGVVQIFDWKVYKQHRPDNDRIGRFPTENEIRFMSYHGILNGATGLFYFTLAPGGKLTAKENPEFWKRVTNVVKELNKFLPVLENGIVVETPEEVQTPLITKSWVYKGNIYTVLLNTSGEEQKVPSALLEKYYKEMFGKKKTATLSPYGVLVLKY